MQGVISESTQFFLLNAWSGIEQVPLDQLEDRLIDADPRRDPYAQRLRSFFLNDKTRRFFVPLSNGKNKNALVIEAELRDALSGIPVSSIIIPQSAPLSRIMSLIEKTAVFAALLMIYGIVVLPFFKDFLSDAAYRHRKVARSRFPFITFLFLTAVFIASGIAAAPAFRIVFVVLPLAFFLVCRILPAWFRWTKARRHGHVLFRPIAHPGVLSRPKRHGPPIIVAVPFAVAAIACAVSFFTGSVGVGSANRSGEGYGTIVSEDEYRSHGRRQTLVSYLPLGIEREENAPPYRHYATDADGLYIAAGTVEETESEIPPYPFGGFAALGTWQPSAVVPTNGLLLFFIALAALLPFAILRIRHENV
jgi:hypothetical protein